MPQLRCAWPIAPEHVVNGGAESAWQSHLQMYLKFEGVAACSLGERGNSSFKHIQMVENATPEANKQQLQARRH
jgi:hypothetical protein